MSGQTLGGSTHNNRNGATGTSAENVGACFFGHRGDAEREKNLSIKGYFKVGCCMTEESITGRAIEIR